MHCVRAGVVGVVLLLTVMRVVSYHVAFGCIHCIRDAYRRISEISVCVSYAVYAARPSVCSRMQHIVCNRMQSYAVMQFGNAYSGPCVCMCMHV